MLIPSLEKIYGNEEKILNKSFKNDVKVDKELSIKYSHRGRGSVRMTQGLFFADDEYEIWRNKILSTDLP